MSERIWANQLRVPAMQPGQLHRPQKSDKPATVGAHGSFQDILQRQMVRFSHHAENRLQQRGIRMDAERLEQLESAVNKAKAKGAKESLILFRDVALIVNVANRTVVTAMDGQQMKDNVFTQIDSAVVIPH